MDTGTFFIYVRTYSTETTAENLKQMYEYYTHGIQKIFWQIAIYTCQQLNVNI